MLRISHCRTAADEAARVVVALLNTPIGCLEYVQVLRVVGDDVMRRGKVVVGQLHVDFRRQRTLGSRVVFGKVLRESRDHFRQIRRQLAGDLPLHDGDVLRVDVEDRAEIVTRYGNTARASHHRSFRQRRRTFG
ncbi:hypothetical protein FQZ97_1081800 [compost metagenome]